MKKVENINEAIETLEKMARGLEKGIVIIEGKPLYTALSLAISHLKAIQEGQYVKLPCKVGNTVYRKNYCTGEIMTGKVDRIFITIGGLNERNNVFFDWPGMYETASFGDFGKTVFLSREEAKEAERCLI